MMFKPDYLIFIVVDSRLSLEDNGFPNLLTYLSSLEMHFNFTVRDAVNWSADHVVCNDWK